MIAGERGAPWCEAVQKPALAQVLAR